jgi:hypothetical protein
MRKRLHIVFVASHVLTNNVLYSEPKQLAPRICIRLTKTITPSIYINTVPAIRPRRDKNEFALQRLHSYRPSSHNDNA